MADYKGLNIRFRGDTTDASKALHILSSEAKAAQGNLNAIQESLKNTATNGKNLDDALKSVQLQQYGNAAQAASGKVDVYKQSLVSLNERLQEAQQKLVTNRDALESMPAKYDALASSASSAFERVAQAQAALDEARQKVEFAGTNSSWLQAIREQSEAQAELNAAISAGDEEFRKVSATYGTLEGAVNSAEESIRATGAEIESTTQKMLVQESQAKALAAEQTRLAASMTSLGQWGAGAQEFGNTLQGVGSALSSIGDKMTIVSGVAAMTFGRNIISSTEEFGNAIAQLGGYLDIQGESLDEMSDQALKWGKDTQFSATEAANAMNELAKGGMTQAQISGGAMQATMELAAAGQLDMAQAAETSVQAIKTFGLSAEDASRVADALAGAANKSTAEVSDLANGFKYVGGWASMAGWNINDVSGALALLSDHGLQSEMAGTALRNVMQRLAAPTDTAAKLMKAYGFSVRDSSGQMVSAVEVVRRLNDTFGQLGDEEKQNVLNDIFGARALPAAIALMNEGADSLQGYIDATTQAGYATEMAQTRMGDLGWALEYLRGEAETAAVNFGQALTPTITGVASAIEDALEWFNSLSDAEQTQIANIALVAVAAGPVLSIVGHLTSGVGEFITAIGSGASNIAVFAQALSEGSSVTAAATMAFEGFGTAMAALPVVAVAGAIGVLVSDMKSMYDEVSLVTDATRGAAEIAAEASESVRGVSDAMESAGPHAMSLAEALASANESLRESADYNREVSDSLKEMEEGVSSAEEYAQTIKELSDAGNLSAADQEKLKQAIEGFNSIAGTSISVIDSQNGKLNIQAGLIDTVTEAYRRQAATTTYVELQKRAMDELTRRQNEYKNSVDGAKSAARDFNTVLQLFGSMHNPIIFANTAAELFNLKTAVEGSGASVDQAAKDVEYYNKKVQEATLSTDDYKKFLESLGIQAKDTANNLSDAGNSLDTYEPDVPSYSSGSSYGSDALNAAKEANDAAIKEMQRAFDQEYKNLQKSLDAEYKARQKEYDKQYKELQKSLDAEYKAQQKAYDKEYDELKKSLDKVYSEKQKEYKKQYDARKKTLDKEADAEKDAADKARAQLKKQLDAAYQLRKKELDRQKKAAKEANSAEESELKKSLDKQYEIRRKELDKQYKAYQKQNDKILKEAKAANAAETKAFNDATKQRVAAIKSEYEARKKNLDDTNGTAEIDDHIKSLQEQTKAEQAEIKRRGEQEKKVELEMAVERAKTRRARADAEKTLNDYLAELAQEARENEREVEIERLNEQKDVIKERTAAQKEALDEERDQAIASYEQQREQELSAINETQELAYETLKTKLDEQEELRKEKNSESLEAYKEDLYTRLDAMKEAHELEIETMGEQATAELEQLKESNEQRVAAQKEIDDARIESIKEQHLIELETLKESQNQELENLKESQSAQLEARKEFNSSQLDALKESQTAQLEAEKEYQTAELEALKESQSEILQALKDSQQDQLDAMRQSGNDMVANANDTTDRMKHDNNQKLADAEAWKNQTKETYRQAAIGMGENLTRTLFGFNPTLSTIAGELYNSAVTEPNRLPSEYQIIGDDATRNMESALHGGVSGIGGAAGAIAREVDGELSPLPRSAGDYGTDTGESFSNGLGQGGETAQTQASNIANGVSNELQIPKNSSHNWGWDMMNNLNSGIINFWDNVLLPNLQNIADSIADLLAHSKPKKGSLKDDDVWFYHMGQNLNKGLMRSVPEIMGTVNDLASGIAEGMNVDVVSDFIDNMRSNEHDLAMQSRRMAEIVSDEFNPYARGNYSVGYDVKPMAQLLTRGVTEALRSGMPQRQGVTVVVQNMQVRNDSDIRRVSEGMYTLVANAERRGW